MKANLRRLVRRILNKYGYPPDKQPNAVQTVLEQAELLAKDWAAFADVPFSLSFKCDGCLYNEFCMKDAAEREDLSLLPYMTGVEKEALRRAGVTTIQALASLKDFATPAPGTPGQKADLVPAPGQEPVVRWVAATWPVGPRRRTASTSGGGGSLRPAERPSGLGPGRLRVAGPDEVPGRAARLPRRRAAARLREV